MYLAKREKGEMLSTFLIWAQLLTFCLILNNLLVEASYKKSEYSIKTIKTRNGDIYDCVDFYKQPSLNHPLLKNHSFYPEMMPSSWPKRGRLDRFTPNNGGFISIKLKDESCPRGTVPIRRMKKNNFFQSKLLQQRYSKLGVNNPNTSESENDSVYFAIGQSKSDLTKNYYGVGAILSVYNPAIRYRQYSSGEIIIKGGSDVIIVGWTVNPNVYDDPETRWFIYTISGGRHCFDSQCGFISVRQDIAPGSPLEPVSQVEGPIYTEKFLVYQDPKNGNWWLTVSNASIDIVVGFWPKEIFTGLHDSGSYIACGGEAYGPLDMGVPEMGTGYIPFFLPRYYYAYCKEMVIVDEAHQTVYVDDVETFLTNKDDYGVYRVKDDELNVYGANKNRFLVIYGGPHVKHDR